jgi:hypothetical protein
MNQGRRPQQEHDSYFIFACCAIAMGIILLLAVAIPVFDWIFN